jgi:predicted Zn-dependent peptidase
MKEQHPQFHTLPNGLRIVHLPTKGEVAHVGITVLAGSRFEENNEIGLAHFIEHSIFKGTKKRRAYHILSRLDAVGGELNAFTSKEEMCIYASFTKRYLNRSMELLADVLVNSTFPEKELEKEKDVIIDEINSYMDSPAEHIFDEFEGQIFANHPLGNNILGTKKTVAAFGRKDILNFIQKHYFAENMVLSVVGPYSMKRVIEIAQKYFSEVVSQVSQIKPLPFKTYSPSDKSVIYSNYQSHIVIGGLAYDLHHKNRLGLAFLTNILGGPALNSKLALAVREKHGLAYSVESSYSPFIDTGYHSIYLGTDKKSLDKAIDLVHRELRTMQEKPLGRIQLSMAKEQLKGHLALASESNANMMIGLGKSVLLYDKIETTKELFAKIDAISSNDLMDIAQETYDAKNLSSLIFVPEEEQLTLK